MYICTHHMYLLCDLYVHMYTSYVLIVFLLTAQNTNRPKSVSTHIGHLLDMDHISASVFIILLPVLIMLLPILIMLFPVLITSCTLTNLANLLSLQSSDVEATKDSPGVSSMSR